MTGRARSSRWQRIHQHLHEHHHHRDRHGGRDAGDREHQVARLEARQRDLEQAAADIADRIRRLQQEMHK